MKQRLQPRGSRFPFGRLWSLNSRLLCFFIVLLFSSPLLSQTLITGRVGSDSITPLQGVTVEVGGTTTATTTDQNGRYSISAGDQAVLVFRTVGFVTQEIMVNGRTEINVIMQTEAPALNEDIGCFSRSCIWCQPKCIPRHPTNPLS